HNLTSMRSLKDINIDMREQWKQFMGDPERFSKPPFVSRFPGLPEINGVLFRDTHFCLECAMPDDGGSIGCFLFVEPTGHAFRSFQAHHSIGQACRKHAGTLSTRQGALYPEMQRISR